MSDVKRFRVTNGSVEEFAGRPVKLEKKLQTLIDRYIETLLDVRFVASEYSTRKTHKGRVFDPCCGSGDKFVQSHGGRRTNISIFGQESNPTTWRLTEECSCPD